MYSCGNLGQFEYAFSVWRSSGSSRILTCVKVARHMRRAVTTWAENPHCGNSGEPFIKSTMGLLPKYASIRSTAVKVPSELLFSGKFRAKIFCMASPFKNCVNESFIECSLIGPRDPRRSAAPSTLSTESSVEVAALGFERRAHRLDLRAVVTGSLKPLRYVRPLPSALRLSLGPRKTFHHLYSEEGTQGSWATLCLPQLSLSAG